MKKDQDFLKSNQSLLQKPKYKFILIYGISWAILATLVILPLEYFVFNKGSFTGRRFISSIAIWLLGGMIYGWWMRWYLIRKQKAIHKH